MPKWVYDKYKAEQVPVALHDMNTTVNIPLLRFRAKAGCLSYSSRDGIIGLRAGLKKMFAKRNFDPVASGNSINRFREEQVKAENADGKYHKQAGGRELKISQEKGAEIKKKMEARWERGGKVATPTSRRGQILGTKKARP